MRRHWPLIGGAILLLATAIFHMTGLPMVSDWLPAQRGQILGALWVSPAIDWSVVAVLWLIAAFRGGREWAIAVAVSAVIPVTMAIALFTIVGIAHPGPFMLTGAVMLALFGASRLR